MFQDSPVFSILSFGIALYLFYMWLWDYRHFAKKGELRKGAFEGATTAPTKLIIIAITSALLLLAIVSVAENLAGATADQTSVAPFALISWIGAGFVEELIFRGYLVVKNKGTATLLVSILFFSLIFAVGHPFLWDYTVEDGASVFSGVWKFNPTLQATIATLSVFCCSLLFYTLRFLPINKNRSILPCICAHIAYNCGVFATKLAQGYVQW
jgi:membrane protease YdiL (CAAX protease family)